MSNTIITVHKRYINSNVPQKFFLLCSASFEKRSTTIPSHLNSNKIIKAIVFYGANIDNQCTLNEICEKIDENKVDCVELNFNKPIVVAEILTKKINEIPNDTAVVIDITTFTHETLTMLLKLIFNNKKKFSSVVCLYNNASDYSNSKVDGVEQMWLSKGCRDIRNIVGFPGYLRPKANTCLVILTGFELERATRLIELIAPDRILLGKGINSTHNNHKAAMRFFQKKFDIWRKNYKYSNYTEFEFSCKNVEETIRVLTELMSKNSNDNYIVVPLNTKLSTIAIAIVGILNKNIQICYAIPEMYNTKTYSTPSNTITVLNLYKILECLDDN